MIVKSFYSKMGRIHSLDVEVCLVKGLPSLHVIGLPDAALKESSLRIKTALQAQGFKWPLGKKVVVNLRPAHVRKQSQGLELAIACAILWETHQIPCYRDHDRLYIYGELGLDGEVLPPSDQEALTQSLTTEDVILCSSYGELYHSKRLPLKFLSELSDPSFFDERVESEVNLYQAPVLPSLEFSQKTAWHLMVAALSQASTLLAGPPGSGKTTFAESLYHLLPPPSPQEFAELRAHHLLLGENLKSLPFVSPHHTTPIMSLIGGGSDLFPGEVVRAHGGLLVLDEFLLFPSRVIEALREPLVSGAFRVSRKGRHVEWPARFQFVATTNLCPCGRLSQDKNFQCGFTLSRCRSVWEKLSGPMLDRFDLVLLYGSYQRERSEEKKVTLKEIQGQVEEARIRAKESPLDQSSLQTPRVFKVFRSRRRELALKKLASALAFLEGSSSVKNRHWNQAFELSQEAITSLQELF